MDTEAIRLVKAMPKWKPGMQKGKAVAVKYTVPVVFRLEGGKTVEFTGDCELEGVRILGSRYE